MSANFGNSHQDYFSPHHSRVADCSEKVQKAKRGNLQVSLHFLSWNRDHELLTTSNSNCHPCTGISKHHSNHNPWLRSKLDTQAEEQLHSSFVCDKHNEAGKRIFLLHVVI